MEAQRPRWRGDFKLRASLGGEPRASLVPDYGYAVALVLKSVPGANIMTDVVIERRRSEYGLFRRVCSYVNGNAGRVP